MEAIEAILTRRTVRHFTNQPVPQEEIQLLLKAAMQAPSAANAQPWHFVVLTDREIIEEVPKFHPNSESLHHAALAVLVCGDDRLVKQPERWILDCAAATENLLLAAHASGYGAVWIGIYPDKLRMDEISKLVGLPKEVHPITLVGIGLPEKTLPPADRYKPERVHWNKF
jgi:nitroreductase